MARRGRSAAGRARPTSATRPGSRGRRRPCRCRARATRWRRGTGSRPRFSSSSISTRCSRASEPWWARAISSLGELVQPQRQPLGEAAVVDEDDRRAVLLDEAQELRVDRRPDRVRAALGAGAISAVGGPVRRAVAPSSRMSSTGTTTWRSSSLRVPASTSRIGRAAGDEAADLLERPLRRGERRCAGRARPTSRSSRSTESARCAPRFVPATACTSSRISVSTRAQHLPRLRGEQQEERLGRRDQDVRRLCAASPRAPSAACRPCGRATRSCDCEPGERAAQVALDVVVERLERRDVEQRAGPRPASA